jgi:glycosyltransferase involved in cell wall biosynthesis
MTSPRPTVSVCVPVHNGAPFVTETLRAVLDQDYPEVTVLVSDDASDDGSEALCSGFATDSRLRIWRQPARLGWVANCNWLLARAESELVCIVSHDDVPEREFLSRLASALGNAPDAALAF